MRRFTLPAQYAREIEGSVSRAVDVCRKDVFRRETGRRPLLEGWMLDNDKPGEEIVVLVGVPKDLLERLERALPELVQSDNAQIPQ